MADYTITGSESRTLPTAGTFTAQFPAGTLVVKCWAGGGGHGTEGSSLRSGGGGAFASKTLVLTAGTYNLQVGAGGNDGNLGGNTWFNTAGTVFAEGGFDGDDVLGPIGGRLSECIGDTKFAGGASSPAQNWGGGSSAGDAATGTDASSAAGAIAPANGGNGGAGNGAGVSGSQPGGGAGGGLEEGVTFGGDGKMSWVFTADAAAEVTATSRNTNRRRCRR